MVIVINAIFEERRGAGGLNATDETGRDEDAQGGINRLQRDRADLGPGCVSDDFRGGMGPPFDSSKYRQPLGRDLDPVLAKNMGGVRSHARQ